LNFVSNLSIMIADAKDVVKIIKNRESEEKASIEKKRQDQIDKNIKPKL